VWPSPSTQHHCLTTLSGRKILQPYSSFQERGLDYAHRYFCLQWSTVHIGALILSSFSWWIELLICLHCDGIQPQLHPAYHLFAVTVDSKVKTDFFETCSQNWENQLLALSCLPLILPLCPHGTTQPAGRIFMKFGIWVLFENLSSFIKIWQE
jgi:hypothetical protein